MEQGKSTAVVVVLFFVHNGAELRLRKAKVLLNQRIAGMPAP